MVDAALIGRILQEYRVKKGMSQELLSGLAGLDRMHYSKIERRPAQPHIGYAVQDRTGTGYPAPRDRPDNRRENGQRRQVIKVTSSQRAG